MKGNKNELPGLLVAVLAAAGLLLAAACLFIGIGKFLKENPLNKLLPGKREKEEVLSLQDFCADHVLDDWFDQLEENTPVELDLVIYGVGPYDITITDRDQILRAARALQTVKIGGVSDTDPNLVNDAGGTGYIFRMEGGGSVQFTFLMGTFKWLDSEYHHVESFGSLKKVEEELKKARNPEITYAYAKDNGFYTQYIDTYRTGWKDEEDFWGGLFIFTEESENIPFVEISRCLGEETDPVAYLGEDYIPSLRAVMESGGGSLTLEEEVRDYELGGKQLLGISCVLEEEGARLGILALALSTRDSLVRQDRLVRFCAVWEDGDESEKERILRTLDTAVRYFQLSHMLYGKGEPQPGNRLVEFCNSEELEAWMARAKEDPPDNVVLTTDTWYMSADKETIRKVLSALESVKIGQPAFKGTGASGRRDYVFTDLDTGSSMNFTFLQDCFLWENKSYQVLDWGGLKDLDSSIMKGRK